MTFTHALATNNYGPQKFIVATSAANGTHTTLASALAAASVGDTVYLRDSVTENVTLPAGVNIASLGGTSLNIPSITGTITMTAAGTSSLIGLRLITNSAFAIAVTGSAASILMLKNCYLDCSNNTGISHTTSSSSSQIIIEQCGGNLGTTGIAFFSSSSAGNIQVFGGNFNNTGSSTTANSFSAGLFVGVNCSFNNPFSFTGTTSTMSIFQMAIVPGSLNVTALTFNSTSAGGAQANYSTFRSGTASAISVGAGAFLLLSQTVVESTNTNVITGAGSVQYGQISNAATGTLTDSINTTTQTALRNYNGINTSSLQPAFLATHSAAQNNVTGNGTTATVNFTTEIFDQNSNYDGTNTFTAPITGRYEFNTALLINDGGASVSLAAVDFTTSNRNYTGQVVFPFSAGNWQMAFSALADMDVADTCIVQGSANGVGADTADFPAAVTQTYFSGYLVC